MHRFKILAAFPKFGDGTSFYRGARPLSVMAKQSDNLELEYISQVGWPILSRGDILFYQRPYLQPHVDGIRCAKQMRMPVWIDYDDNMFDLPEKSDKNIQHPNFRFWQDEKIRDNVKRCLELADIVSVSTEALKDALPCDKEKMRVIPNALDNSIYSFDPIMERAQVILWRGTNVHHADMAAFQNEIVQLSEKLSNWTFAFVGQPNLKVIAPIKNKIVIQPVPFEQFYYVLRDLKPSVCIVPMEENKHTICKSPIAAIEAAYAGAVCVAPNFEAWHGLGCIHYGNNQEFFDGVMRACEKNLEPTETRRLISENRLLTQVNMLRFEVVDRFVSQYIETDHTRDHSYVIETPYDGSPV